MPNDVVLALAVQLVRLPWDRKSFQFDEKSASDLISLADRRRYLFPNKLVTLSLHDLKPGQPYAIRTLLVSDKDNQVPEISNIGKAVSLDRNRSIMPEKETQAVEIKLAAQRSVGSIMLRSVDTAKLRLFGIEIRAVDDAIRRGLIAYVGFNGPRTTTDRRSIFRSGKLSPSGGRKNQPWRVFIRGLLLLIT
ncbi:MAG: hypothetical protein ACR2Q4_08665 [Geminicoccaceae bacterium]